MLLEMTYFLSVQIVPAADEAKEVRHSLEQLFMEKLETLKDAPEEVTFPVSRIYLPHPLLNDSEKLVCFSEK